MIEVSDGECFVRICIWVLFSWLVVILAGCGSEQPSTGGYAKLIVGIDGFYHPQLGETAFVLGNFTFEDEALGLTINVVRKSVDPEGGVLAPGFREVDGVRQKIEQCGTYSIGINVNGEVCRIRDFRYSGEANLIVARGVGWYVQISRKEWPED